MDAILTKADRSSAAEAAKENKTGELAIYSWRKNSGGMGAAEARLPRAREAEIAGLKKLLADRDWVSKCSTRSTQNKW